MHASSSVSIDFDALNTDSLYALSNSNLSIVFRFLRDGDQNEVKTLCHDCFPIEYPDTWYNDIVQSKEYFALAACNVNTEKIIALIVAKVFPLGSCNHYEQKILHKTFSLTTSVCYILILGVTKEYRRQGLATRLLQNLLNMLYKYETCKAVYLHVLYSNKQAIKFYQSNLFQYRLHLPYYYFIKDEHLDAYCFVRYTNGKIVSIHLILIIYFLPLVCFF